MPQIPMIDSESQARYDLSGDGPWTLSAAHGTEAEFITTHEGPITASLLATLDMTYPGVAEWSCRPQLIDETYANPAAAVHRLRKLLDVDTHTAHAILTIAADEKLGMQWTYGPWLVTGDDDELSWRIRRIAPPATAGWVVLVNDVKDGTPKWEPDWDGQVHTGRADADEELSACRTHGYQCVLGEVRFPLT